MNCPGCNKPMVDGQVFNGLLKCHWDCQDIVKAQSGAQEAGMSRAILRMAQDGIVPGHPLYQRMLAELVEALR